jgi:hypothetical protein
MAGRFPPVDGGWQRVEPWLPGVEAVVALTGHAVLCIGDDVPDDELEQLGVDGYGGAHHPAVALLLAGGGHVDVLDVLLVAPGTGAGPGPLVPRDDLADHPRALHALQVRADVQVWGPASGSAPVLLSRGIGGLPELSLELPPDATGGGRGRDLVRAARGLVADGEPMVACVAPGNARSLRAFLAAGFVPVGSVQLVVPERD